MTRPHCRQVTGPLLARDETWTCVLDSRLWQGLPQRLPSELALPEGNRRGPVGRPSSRPDGAAGSGSVPCAAGMTLAGQDRGPGGPPRAAARWDQADPACRKAAGRAPGLLAPPSGRDGHVETAPPRALRAEAGTARPQEVPVGARPGWSAWTAGLGHVPTEPGVTPADSVTCKCLFKKENDR